LSFTFLSNILYVGIAYAGYLVSNSVSWLNYASIGFSGVLFGLVVIETKLSPNETRSIFGMCVVPAYLYPWALLIILQFLPMNISFLGHLCGLLLGFFFVQGWLNVICPTHAQMIAFEEHSLLRWMTNRVGFVKHPTSLNQINFGSSRVSIFDLLALMLAKMVNASRSITARRAPALNGIAYDELPQSTPGESDLDLEAKKTRQTYLNTSTSQP
jgi:hypothetical protein